MTDERDRAALDYGSLVRFLVEPLLEERDALRVDCEHVGQSPRFLVRVAFAEGDRHHVLGHHGRVVQAMRSVLDFAARSVGQTARLEIYGEHEHRADAHGRGSRDRHQGHEDRPHAAKPRPRPPRPKPRSSQT